MLHRPVEFTPFGSALAADGKTLISNPDEQEIITLIQECRAAGIHCGLLLLNSTVRVTEPDAVPPGGIPTSTTSWRQHKLGATRENHHER